MRLLIRALIVLFLTEAVSVRAQVAVTVYNQNLGVVREIRPFELSEGLQNLRFKDVAAQIDPTSVSLTGPEGFKILEQNYDYDLLSSDKLLRKYVDKKLSAFDKSGKLFEGPLLSFDAGNLVLGAEDGGVRMLSRSEITRLDFPSVPGGLITQPTLNWKVTSPVSGKKNLTLTYMTQGMNWHCEYVAVVTENEKNLDWTGWVSLDNQCGTSFKEAKLKLVAGDMHQAEQPGLMRKTMMAAATNDSSAFQEKSFFEYHLYTLQKSVDIAENQVKQVELLKAKEVTVKKIYTYDPSVDANKVSVQLELKNSKDIGMGMPLPAGKVRVYKADTDGSLEFIGEDNIDHTPTDEKIRLEIGKSFDVIGESKELNRKRISDKIYDTEMEIKLRNHRKETLSVLVVGHAWSFWKILQNSQEYHKKDANTFEFNLDLPSDKEVVLSYTLRSEQ